MSLAPVSAFASTPPARPRRTDPERAGPDRRRQVRLRCVHSGRETYPYLGNVTAETVEFYHHATKQAIPMPLEQLIRMAAEVDGSTPEAVLQWLSEKFESAPSLTPSGLSAPSSEIPSNGNPADGRTGDR